MIEVIATNLSDAKLAEQCGVDRIELSPSMLELGITPSMGLIESVLEEVRIPFNVMIRPHSQSFVYNRDDIRVMQRDIAHVRDLGVNGIVLGGLTAEKEIDVYFLEKMLEVSGDLEITFHKAFDEVPDQLVALETLMQYEQVMTIATSGGLGGACDNEANLRQLIAETRGSHLSIMIAGGLTMDNCAAFKDRVQPDVVHFGSGVRIDNSYLQPLDEKKIQYVRSIF